MKRRYLIKYISKTDEFYNAIDLSDVPDEQLRLIKTNVILLQKAKLLDRDSEANSTGNNKI